MDFSDIINATVRKNLIEENYQKAIEEIPESLTKIDMLYIPAIINGKNVKLFIDTGAQMSIMPLLVAVNMGMEEIIDFESQGIAQGVGEQEILGKIHFAELHLDDFILGCSFTILDKQEDIILGLDMLMAHGMILDLKKKCIILSNKEIYFCNKD